MIRLGLVIEPARFDLQVKDCVPHFDFKSKIACHTLTFRSKNPWVRTPSTKKGTLNKSLYRDPLGARTQDPNIKSVVLYQLS